MPLKFLFFVSLALSAQTPENPGMFEYLRDHLQLTREQYAKIQANNAAYGDWVLEKLKRMKTEQEEIAVESKRETIVPGALGLRYTEIEVIGRERLARRAQLYVENRKLLSEAQLAKFKAFDEVFKLQPVILTVRDVKLLEGEDPCFQHGAPGGAYAQFCSGSVPYVSLP